MDETYTQDYEQFELQHWWFVARREIIHQALDRHVKTSAHNPSGKDAGVVASAATIATKSSTDAPNIRWLDIGCGTGVLLDSYPAIKNKLGLEMDGGSVARAQAKGLDVRQVSASWDFSQYGSFDLITLTDVIEHVEHEREAIDAVRSALAHGGILLVTVPALMSLWSSHDVVNRHYRRYTLASLKALFPQSQWDILQASYFSSFLLPLVWIARKWKNFRTAGEDPSHAGHDFKFGALDGLFKLIFRQEKPWLRFGRLPLGSSVLLVLRKKG